MQQRRIQTDGLTQQILEAGEGPLVIFCHGFPELGSSWRRQLPALAAAGFHAVAPDMRGYGGTDRPQAVEAYTILNLVGDMVDLVRALGHQQAVIVGHDWGAPVAWHAALLRPDVFRAVAALSVPFQPRRPGRPPIETYKAIAARKKLGDFYMLQFQEPGAEAAFEADVAGGLTRAFYAYDGATPDERRSTGFTPEGVAFLDSVTDAVRPPWMDAEELATYVAAFEASGFGGPFNWYRNLDRNWSLMAFAQDRTIDVPALFAVGQKDPVRNYAGHAEAELKRWVPDLRVQAVIPGAGHWLQQERPEEVNRLLIELLKGL
ncbi:alpha/beta fold hydrolase [Caulobacter sp. 17J80-11]|uniref:alpha/beta fold hydrolase n=1 Tax=Caulobacter sp. 17J80-11 TaxID=2763502 RepID=UPI00165352D0|nr:alpha/beta hydrolase [Caulobacter sp. 17J80-11]MBC6980444.1 alpha/beta hydrolase [Caulobacter sp. 17J80-11]